MSRDRELHTFKAPPPNLPMTLGKLAAPTEIRVRSGVQGVDYMGPNAFFTAALPRAQFCAVDLIY